MANSVDLDQMPCTTASDLGLYTVCKCLSVTVPRVIMVYFFFHFHIIKQCSIIGTVVLLYYGEFSISVDISMSEFYPL